MKLLLTFVFAIISLDISAQKNQDDLLGKWINEDITARFEFFKTGNTYNAKIIWLAKPKNENGELKLDKNNSDKKLRNRPILGMVLLTGLQFSSNNSIWYDGKIYNPERGETLACKIKLNNKNELALTVSKNIFSSTKKWKRYDK
ncbi:MAG: DUF2147 domain-containing protein [Chitinophagaceae bacterium]|jgi:uncharacterized protein (DUF2147 family)|nr:DUF2147 domain-containing protein [Chitinophagaceae bacterium]